MDMDPRLFDRTQVELTIIKHVVNKHPGIITVQFLLENRLASCAGPGLPQRCTGKSIIENE